jgi:transcriptional regulator with XRE-family HTH domain
LPDDHEWTAEDAAFNWELCKRVASARKAAGKTQATLAAQTGISYSTLCGIEQGRVRVGLTLLQRLADGLGISATTLWPRADQVPPAAE